MIMQITELDQSQQAAAIIHSYHQKIGALGGRARSVKKAEAARRNGSKGAKTHASNPAAKTCPKCGSLLRKMGTHQLKKAGITKQAYHCRVCKTTLNAMMKEQKKVQNKA
jgi:hypothetical protein